MKVEPFTSDPPDPRAVANHPHPVYCIITSTKAVNILPFHCWKGTKSALNRIENNYTFTTSHLPYIKILPVNPYTACKLYNNPVYPRRRAFASIPSFPRQLLITVHAHRHQPTPSKIIFYISLQHAVILRTTLSTYTSTRRQRISRQKPLVWRVCWVRETRGGVGREYHLFQRRRDNGYPGPVIINTLYRIRRRKCRCWFLPNCSASPNCRRSIPDAFVCLPDVRRTEAMGCSCMARANDSGLQLSYFAGKVRKRCDGWSR